MKETTNSTTCTTINRRLPSICERVCEVLSEQSKTDDTRRLVLSFVRRAQRTVLGVNALQQQVLWEPAQILTRTLFEGQLRFRRFAQLYEADSFKACQRFLDAIMLADLKHFSRVKDRVSIDDEQVQRMRAAEDVIRQRYGEKECKRIRSWGFTGLSLEAIAIKEGQVGNYDLVYRLFSRNVHSTDVAEITSLDMASPLPNQQCAIADRNELTLYIAGSSTAGIAELTNRICGCGLDTEISSISEKLNAIKPPT